MTLSVSLHPPHNPGCLRQYGLILDRVTRRAFFLPCYRGRWDCPACAQHKLGKVTQHLATRNVTLCWGPHSDSLRTQARRKGLGWMSITYRDDDKMMVAESRLYTPQLPSLTVIQQLVQHTSEREISRIAWADKWRPQFQGDPTRYEFISTDSTDLPTLQAGLKQAGVLDGSIGNMSIEVVKAKIDQILNGVTFNSG